MGVGQPPRLGPDAVPGLRLPARPGRLVRQRGRPERAGRRTTPGTGPTARVLTLPTDRANEYFLRREPLQARARRPLPVQRPGRLPLRHPGLERVAGGHRRHATTSAPCSRPTGTSISSRTLNQGDGGDLYGPVAGVGPLARDQSAARWWDGADVGLIISGVGAPGAVDPVPRPGRVGAGAGDGGRGPRPVPELPSRTTGRPA